MTVTVTPEIFKAVYYDAGEIAKLAQQLLDLLDIGSLNLLIAVDETIALTRLVTQLGDPVQINVMSRAFEDLSRPMYFDQENMRLSLGRGLLRVRDRLNGDFVSAPDDNDLSLIEFSAWETYCVGRLTKLGLKVNKQRWKYNFRNRHGFSDCADQQFETIWNADSLTWQKLLEISEQAVV